MTAETTTLPVIDPASSRRDWWRLTFYLLTATTITAAAVTWL